MPDESMDMPRVRERFAEAKDFTVGIEEEFALLDPSTHELVQRYEELIEASSSDEVLAEAARGELIASEIEIASGRGETFDEAASLQQERRMRLFGLADGLGIELAAMGTHPWASYLDQRIIDTPHYQRLERDLAWVVRRNNTWSMHVHVGVNDADRAIAVCDHLSGLLPELLALSANSPFLDGRDTGLHSVRTEIFTRLFPRCGIPEPFGDWQSYAEFIEVLDRVGSVVESTQLWWSVRPHHTFGTVEVRICDAQTRGEESFGLAGVLVGCVAQAALDYDEGKLGASLRPREVEENLWRAIRYGMDGRMVDFAARRERPTAEAVERMLAWSEPARTELGIGLELPALNGAQRARARLAEGASIPEIYAEVAAETRRTYAGGLTEPSRGR